MEEPAYSLEPLLDLIDRLRGENGCPWDRKQTPQSFIKYLGAEAEELSEAIMASDNDGITEEFGDVVFLLSFLIRLLEDDAGFDFRAAVSGVIEKMKRRHPHVFGDCSVADADEVVRNWKTIKEREKAAKAESEKVSE